MSSFPRPFLSMIFLHADELLPVSIPTFRLLGHYRSPPWHPRSITPLGLRLLILNPGFNPGLLPRSLEQPLLSLPPSPECSCDDAGLRESPIYGDSTTDAITVKSALSTSFAYTTFPAVLNLPTDWALLGDEQLTALWGPDFVAMKRGGCPSFKDQDGEPAAAPMQAAGRSMGPQEPPSARVTTAAPSALSSKAGRSSASPWQLQPLRVPRGRCGPPSLPQSADPSRPHSPLPSTGSVASNPSQLPDASGSICTALPKASQQSAGFGDAAGASNGLKQLRRSHQKRPRPEAPQPAAAARQSAQSQPPAAAAAALPHGRTRQATAAAVMPSNVKQQLPEPINWDTATHRTRRPLQRIIQRGVGGVAAPTSRAYPVRTLPVARTTITLAADEPTAKTPAGGMPSGPPAPSHVTQPTGKPAAGAPAAATAAAAGQAPVAAAAEQPATGTPAGSAVTSKPAAHAEQSGSVDRSAAAGSEAAEPATSPQPSKRKPSCRELVSLFPDSVQPPKRHKAASKPPPPPPPPHASNSTRSSSRRRGAAQSRGAAPSNPAGEPTTSPPPPPTVQNRRTAVARPTSGKLPQSRGAVADATTPAGPHNAAAPGRATGRKVQDLPSTSSAVDTGDTALPAAASPAVASPCRLGPMAAVEAADGVQAHSDDEEEEATLADIQRNLLLQQRRAEPASQGCDHHGGAANIDAARRTSRVAPLSSGLGNIKRRHHVLGSNTNEPPWQQQERSSWHARASARAADANVAAAPARPFAQPPAAKSPRREASSADGIPAELPAAATSCEGSGKRLQLANAHTSDPIEESKATGVESTSAAVIVPEGMAAAAAASDSPPAVRTTAQANAEAQNPCSAVNRGPSAALPSPEARTPAVTAATCSLELSVRHDTVNQTPTAAAQTVACCPELSVPAACPDMRNPNPPPPSLQSPLVAAAPAVVAAAPAMDPSAALRECSTLASMTDLAPGRQGLPVRSLRMVSINSSAATSVGDCAPAAPVASAHTMPSDVPKAASGTNPSCQSFAYQTLGSFKLLQHLKPNAPLSSQTPNAASNLAYRLARQPLASHAPADALGPSDRTRFPLQLAKDAPAADDGGTAHVADGSAGPLQLVTPAPHGLDATAAAVAVAAAAAAGAPIGGGCEPAQLPLAAPTLPSHSPLLGGDTAAAASAVGASGACHLAGVPPHVAHSDGAPMPQAFPAPRSPSGCGAVALQASPMQSALTELLVAPAPNLDLGLVCGQEFEYEELVDEDEDPMTGSCRQFAGAISGGVGGDECQPGAGVSMPTSDAKSAQQASPLEPFDSTDGAAAGHGPISGGTAKLQQGVSTAPSEALMALQTQLAPGSGMQALPVSPKAVPQASLSLQVQPAATAKA